MLPNSRFPLLVHRDGIPGGGADAVQARFRDNGWLNNWRYPGIYTYPHFHSTTHECLGVATGWMEVELFGSGGTRVRVETGDVIVLPAGVSHSMTGNSDDILMVGGYPEGRDWDNIQEGHITEEVRRAAAKRIMMLPIPAPRPGHRRADPRVDRGAVLGRRGAQRFPRRPRSGLSHGDRVSQARRVAT